MLIDLLQPKHIYATQEGKGQIYMPTSLLTAGARIKHAGVEVNLYDENLHTYDGKAEIIGLNLLGAPYIWKGIQLMSEIREKRRGNVVFLLGGQVVDGLLHTQFDRLFGRFNAINGNIDRNLAELLKFDSKLLPAPECTSLISIYKDICDAEMFDYLSNEFSFYVSQGCKFSCDFCAAVRTRKDPVTGKKICVKEVYRDMSVINKDLSYLITRAKSLGINELKIYLSNLDLFQTPEKLYQFAKTCNSLKTEHPDFKLNLRGLASPDSFLKAVSKYPYIVIAIVKAGLYSVGFGIDGMTSDVWNRIKKGHNTEEKCIEAIKLARNEYSITPELLMTFGHDNIDNETSLSAACEFTQEMIDLYGAIPRPHIAKSFIPGNNGWFEKKNSKKVDTLMTHPYLFQSLDFVALPTAFTHSNKETCRLAKKYFLQLCSLKENTTQYVKSFTPYMSQDKMRRIELFNMNRFDH